MFCVLYLIEGKNIVPFIYQTYLDEFRSQKIIDHVPTKIVKVKEVTIDKTNVMNCSGGYHYRWL